MIVNQILRYGGGEEVKKNLYPSLQSFFLTPFPHNSGSSRFGSQLPLKNLAFETPLPFFHLGISNYPPWDCYNYGDFVGADII